MIIINDIPLSNKPISIDINGIIIFEEIKRGTTYSIMKSITIAFIKLKMILGTLSLTSFERVSFSNVSSLN